MRKRIAGPGTEAEPGLSMVTRRVGARGAVPSHRLSEKGPQESLKLTQEQIKGRRKADSLNTWEELGTGSRKTQGPERRL